MSTFAGLLLQRHLQRIRVLSNRLKSTALGDDKLASSLEGGNTETRREHIYTYTYPTCFSIAAQMLHPDDLRGELPGANAGGFFGSSILAKLFMEMKLN